MLLIDYWRTWYRHTTRKSFCLSWTNMYVTKVSSCWPVASVIDRYHISKHIESPWRVQYVIPFFGKQLWLGRREGNRFRLGQRISRGLRLWIGFDLNSERYLHFETFSQPPWMKAKRRGSSVWPTFSHMLFIFQTNPPANQSRRGGKNRVS